MTKAVTDILRKRRADCLRRAESADKEATEGDSWAAAARERAREARELHCQLGAAIQVLEGDDAVLDLPVEPETAIAAS